MSQRRLALTAGPFNRAGDLLHGEAGLDACGDDDFDSEVGCEE